MSLLRPALKVFSSLKLTLVCLTGLMVLVAACTVAQVSLGTYGAVKTFMRSFVVYWPVSASLKIPVWPGGASLGLLLLVNLTVAQLSRLEWSRRKAGLWLVHLGLILLFGGEFVAGFFQKDAQMAIDEGQSARYAESERDVELAVVDETDPGYDQVYALPANALARGGSVAHPGLPFSIRALCFYRNSDVKLDAAHAAANRGVGRSVAVAPLEPVTADDQRDQSSAVVELSAGGQSLGTWLVSTAFGPMPQRVSFGGRSFRLSLRPAREYFPFTLTLKKFRHDVYPGTDIPRNFSSLLALDDAGGGARRDVLISMNRPLRYAGKAFYQASFGKGDTMTVLQVVDNPGWFLPYLSCALVALGLLAHFTLRLRPSLAGASR